MNLARAPVQSGGIAVVLLDPDRPQTLHRGQRLDEHRRVGAPRPRQDHDTIGADLQGELEAFRFGLR
jgi:hypothetical protein